MAGGGWSAGCGFADYDRDGDLDLFVSRYVKIDLANLPEFGRGKTCEYRGIAGAVRPARPARRSATSCSATTATAGSPRSARRPASSDPRGYFGLGVAWFDVNGDGWPDLYVANDSTPNFLYVNQKDGTFKDVAFPLGVAVSEDGAEQGSMGVAVGDYDNSGRFEPVRDQLLRGVQRPLPQRRRPLHRHVVPLADRAPAACPTSAGAPRSSTTTTTACWT